MYSLIKAWTMSIGHDKPHSWNKSKKRIALVLSVGGWKAVFIQFVCEFSSIGGAALQHHDNYTYEYELRSHVGL